jgi:ATP-dependent helicase/nuclease subunit A
MGDRISLLPDLHPEQKLAADPQAHAALSASAGSGKTQVLTARVLRLLMQGARPESILCLTFTKAAAAEMANRIGSRLASWVRLPDTKLRKDLFALGEATGPEALARARKLFATVLDCPGGLRIQTIHAFAQSLLAAFPAEAGIVPGFRPIEGRAEQELIRRTLAGLLSNAEAAGDQQLLLDVQCLSRRLGEESAVEYLSACSASAEALAHIGRPEDIEPLLRRVMELPDGDVDAYLAERCGDDRFDCDLLRAIAAANRQWGGKEGSAHHERIERWLSLGSAERARELPDLALLVFTKSAERRKVRPGQVKVDPEYEARSDRIAAAIADLQRVQNGVALAATMAAGLRAGKAFADAYARAKRSEGVADFADLIQWTRALLAKPGMGDWVRYKLDRQIDHVLIDEAQDTNEAQWEIVGRLVEEYFTGSSESEERWRTLFLVGDFKQAIYGFQGTDPNKFVAAREGFKEQAEALQAAEDTVEQAKGRARAFHDLSVAANFRSAQPILDAVDAVIDTLGYDALALPEAPPPHRADRPERPGLVELRAPFALADEEDEGEDEEGEERWIDLRDRLYAGALAEQIGKLIAEAPFLPSKKRPLGPGDILVLVRSRGELASLLVARLFAAGVPVAGLDRLHLHEPLAVQDLLSAMRFAVQPGDDLSLACLLVSPLFGWSQDQLAELAWGRPGSLWGQLRRRSGESRLLARTHEELTAILNMADHVPPSRFLETILSGPLGGRRKLYSRLGLASRDPIDELMNSALDFERSETASLDGFLSWFSHGEVDVQRDAAEAGDEVRVMTVHGAKGLEAPVVILADATGDPAKLGRTPLTLQLPVGESGRVPLLRPKREERCEPFTSLIEREEERDLQEHWRLLYVAMTRAADRLIVAGAAPKRERPQNCWHRAVERALAALGAESDGAGGLVYGTGGKGAGSRPRAAHAPAAAALPAWAFRMAPEEARPPQPLAPSALGSDTEQGAPPSPAMRAAARRGVLIHALLERLPALAPAERKRAGDRWLQHSGGVAEAAERDELVETVCGILADVRFADVFGSGSLGEAPLAATLPDGRVIAGTVDRLLVEPRRVTVIDFKTGAVPAHAAAIPAAHLRQMEAYGAALQVIFPAREVRTALLYTAAPRLFELTG